MVAHGLAIKKVVKLDFQKYLVCIGLPVLLHTKGLRTQKVLLEPGTSSLSCWFAVRTIFHIQKQTKYVDEHESSSYVHSGLQTQR